MEDPRKQKGTCEMCGVHNRDLRILAIDDFIGWACEECRQQLHDCLPRRFCSSGEHSEPSE